MSGAFKLSINHQGVAWLVLDLPDEKHNTLSIPVLEELEKIIDSLASNPEVKVLALRSGKEDSFIAGVDLRAFDELFKDFNEAQKMVETGHRVFNKIAALPFPSVAFMHGVSFGGGTELALACTFRAASDSPKTMIALPEVTLGIYPAWGGSQRLVRITGLMQGLPFILSGRSKNGVESFKMKLVDAVFASEFFDEQAGAILNQILSSEGRKRLIKAREAKGVMYYALEANPIGRELLFKKARKDILIKTKGHYAAPLVLLDLVKKTHALPLQEGLKLEITTFISFMRENYKTARNLIGLFFTTEALKKDNGVKSSVQGMEINSAAVIGAGTMGSLIAFLFSFKDIPVRLKDINWQMLGKGFSAIAAVYKKLVQIRKLKRSESSLKFHQISATTDYSGFQHVDIVVEAATEDLELKKKILKELEPNLRSEALIGTNTSSLRVADIGSALTHPERFLGLHFFNPPDRMPLVEVVASDKTSDEAIVTGVKMCRNLGKTPIVVKDCAGFLVNRIFLPGANEIIRVYEEGAKREQVEKVLEDFGMPMSPFVLSDEVGIDVAYKASKVLEKAYGKRMELPRLLSAMYESKLYGRKGGSGFFIYTGKNKRFNPQVEELKKDAPNIRRREFSDVEICDRVFLIMINEAARCLNEGIVANPSYLDLALIMGIGFPPFRGGLLRFADELGIDTVVSKLYTLQKEVGERFAPCEHLLKMQKDKATFYKG